MPFQACSVVSYEIPNDSARMISSAPKRLQAFAGQVTRPTL